MTVTVAPDEFRFVEFDAALVRRVAEQLIAALGIDRPVHVEVDETTPLARVHVSVGDTITVSAESGAFENTRRPREQSEDATAAAIGRALLKARDRLHGGFGEAPPDDELTLAQISAWNVYCAGRLARLGLRVSQQQWRYDFRNRFGFSDDTDSAFDRVWSADGLTWAELMGTVR